MLLSAVAAAVLAAAAFVASGAIRGTFPFGDVSRNTNDLGQQLIPVHGRLRDVLTGDAAGDLVFNWSSGFGVPFLGDYLSYLGSTLSWLVLLFPRDGMDLALFVIAVVALALAAAAMTAYLRLLRPRGPAWLSVVAGASYALCGWAIDDGAYLTVWLYGLVAFPVLCLLCEWILRRRSSWLPVCVTPFVVALLWTSQFYTVYMATIGAAIVVLVRVLSWESSVSWRTRLAGLLRCAVAVVAGMGLAAPLLVPMFWAARYARPSPETEFHAMDWRDFLSRLLAGTEGVGSSPGLAVGTVLLLLAVSLPFNRAVPWRERLVWTGAVGLTVLSMQVALTHAVWHGFDTPNGSPFRQAFVVAGLLVIAGWISGSAGLRGVAPVLAPLVLVGGLYLAVRSGPFVTPTTRVVVPVVAAVALVAWLAWRFTERGRPWVAAVAAGVVGAAVIVEATAGAVAIDEARTRILSTHPVWGDENDQVRALVQGADRWPEARVSPGAYVTQNDPMLLGGQGSQYYSSTIPDDVSVALAGLGFGYSAYVRANVDPANPVVDAVFAVGARVVTDDAGTLRLAENPDVAPLVTVRPAEPWTSPDPAPFGHQETALGADVYTVPRVELVPDPALTVIGRRRDSLLSPAVVGEPAELRVTASCPAGTEVYMAAPAFVGDVLAADTGWRAVLGQGTRAPGVYNGAPLLRVGTAGADGAVEVKLRVYGPARLPASPLGCLDRTALSDAVAGLRAGAPTSIDVTGHGVAATLPPSSTPSTVVLGVIRSPGWRCSAGDGPATTPTTAGGLIALPVPAGVTDVSCEYRPRGLRMGLAVGAAALAVVAALGVVGLVQRRRRDAWVVEQEKSS
ncbi:YfhO family protein [Jiangella muralis]|uniref:YfhO family protein n=1 Tax=Jiangella muralis TaxID=702383 RepID=UPI00069FA8A5|nr:YfhO family protein [Jiangella muralis]